VLICQRNSNVGGIHCMCLGVFQRECQTLFPSPAISLLMSVLCARGFIGGGGIHPVGLEA